MGKSTGKVREKSGNFVCPEKWEPCVTKMIGAHHDTVTDVLLRLP